MMSAQFTLCKHLGIVLIFTIGPFPKIKLFNTECIFDTAANAVTITFVVRCILMKMDYETASVVRISFLSAYYKALNTCKIQTGNITIN